MSTSFSGIGCPEVAARILTETAVKKGFCSKKWHVSQCFTHSWPASHTFGLGVWGPLCGSHTGSHTGSLRNCLLLRPKVSYLRAIEWDKNCQKALLMQDSDQHIFGDITTVFPANPLAPKMVQCSRHGCPCPATAIADVEVAGPPCIFFSRMDKRLGVGDVRYSCHLSWLQGAACLPGERGDLRERGLLPQGRVGEAAGRHLPDSVGSNGPRLLRHPLQPAKGLAILVHKKRAAWNSNVTFEEFASWFKRRSAPSGCN